MLLYRQGKPAAEWLEEWTRHCCRTKANTASTQVLIKDVGIQIVKLVLECLLRSHGPAHIIHMALESDTIKTVEDSISISCLEH